MRTDSIQFAHANEAANREPRCVIKIEFDTNSPHLTSHDDIEGVPGDVIYGVVQRPSAISQRIIPDEGRSEIGEFTFTLVDKDGAFTAAMRDQLVNQLAGLRRRRVEFWVGYKGMDFSEFQLFQTQIVARCTYKAGSYQVRCSDITRELRKEVFRPASTTLRESLGEADLVVQVYDTSKLQMVPHGPSYSDAPNSTVGYVRIEDEVIRYSSKTPDTLYVDGTSGRGCLNTKAVGHAVDVGTSAERRTKVEEFIYLEGPGPKIALAVLSGSVYGGGTLPDNWHLGIDSSFIRTSDFTGIGSDLWDPADDTASLIFRFDGLKQQDGKRFLEREIYLLLGCYSPVYADGTMGLRRMTSVISDASPVVTLTEREIIELSELEHEYTLIHNDFRIEWAYNPIVDAFQRSSGFVDAYSVEAHGAAPLQSYEFKGVHSQRFTDSALAVRLDSIRDRYSEPPQTITATVLGSLNRIEVGDISRIRVPETILRDFAGTAGEYNRAFEVQQRTYDWVSGDVTLDLFGSSARPYELPSPTDPTDRALPDAWYTSSGANLSSVIPIAGNLASPGSYVITGAASLLDPAAIYYWDNDLTIPDGCNITITGNVQLRIRGFLTLNGTINGSGGGKAGTSDPGTGTWDTTFAGNPGFVVSSRGWDGIRAISRLSRTPHQLCNTIPAVFTRAQYDTFPLLTLQVVDGELTGLPNDMRGTGGAPGGRIVSFSTNPSDPPPIIAVGGTGGNGGAGLAIICRGMGFGVSASITLNGTSTTSGALVMSYDVPMYAAAGGPGGPGALLILLDGNNVSVPVITGKVIATTGGITQSGNPMKAREATLIAGGFELNPDVTKPPHCGYADPGLIGAWVADSTVPNVVMSPLDTSNSAHRIQYIPVPQDAENDADTNPPPPTDLLAANAYQSNFLTWGNPDIGTFDVIEIFASLDNDRTNSQKVGETRANSFAHDLPLGGLRYYWIRSKVNPVSGRPPVYSDWEPEDRYAGVTSNAEAPGQIEDAPDDFTAVGKVNGIQFNWSLPVFKLLGKLQIYEGAAGSNFADAALVWEDYGFGYFLTKADTTTRSYWLVLVRGTRLSVPEPSPTLGLEAAASSVTSALSAYAFPTSVSRSATLGPNPRFVISPPTTVTASGGTPPYSYAWTIIDGSGGVTIDYPTFPDTTFSGSNNLDGTVKWATARCTVTDSAAATAVADVAVQLNWPSIA